MPLPPTDQLACALRRMESEDAVALPFLDEVQRRALLAATETLSYRAARPLVGGAGREVRQDFVLTMAIPEPHPLRALAASLEGSLNAALAALSPSPLPGGVRLNDLIVQRYEPGSVGITPHRDHIRYVGLVALVTLAGRGRFALCADRAGSDPRPLPLEPGGLLLMRAPGYGGRPDRPFHCIEGLDQGRVSLGLRHDTRPGEAH